MSITSIGAPALTIPTRTAAATKPPTDDVKPDGARWSASPQGARWSASPQGARWSASPDGARWSGTPATSQLDVRA